MKTQYYLWLLTGIFIACSCKTSIQKFNKQKFTNLRPIEKDQISENQPDILFKEKQSQIIATEKNPIQTKVEQTVNNHQPCSKDSVLTPSKGVFIYPLEDSSKVSPYTEQIKKAIKSKHRFFIKARNQVYQLDSVQLEKSGNLAGILVPVNYLGSWSTDQIITVKHYSEITSGRISIRQSDIKDYRTVSERITSRKNEKGNTKSRSKASLTLLILAIIAIVPVVPFFIIGIVLFLSGSLGSNSWDHIGAFWISSGVLLIVSFLSFLGAFILK